MHLVVRARRAASDGRMRPAAGVGALWPTRRATA